MSALAEKVKASIERIQGFAGIADKWSPDGKSGYYLAFSGGKDSVVVKRLLDMAGVKYQSHYTITSVDPPELVRFIREKYPDVSMDYPLDKNGNVVTMWNLIPGKMFPPTRTARYCCDKIKESGGNDRFTVTGVRWAESTNRKHNQGIVTAKDNIELPENEHYKKTARGGIILTNDNEDARRELESCQRLHKMLLNPIIDWSDSEVWQFILQQKIPYCSLYDEGFKRIGCIGCPMARKHGREREFLRWPKFKRAYLQTFERLIDARTRAGKDRWVRKTGTTAQDIFNWWMEYDTLPGQMDLLEDYEE